MMSKNLFIKRFKQDLEQRIWLPVLFFIISFLFLEILLVSRLNDLQYRNNFVENAINYLLDSLFSPVSAFWIITMIVAVVGGLTGFSYLHSARKLDVYHSIPVKRETLFLQQYVYGILYFMIPLMLHVIICLVIALINGIPIGSIIGHILGFMLVQILIYLMTYSVTILAVCLTGNTVISVLGSSILLTYTLILELLKTSLMSDFYKTYYDVSQLSGFPVLSPMHLWYRFNEKLSDGSTDWTYASEAGFYIKFILMAAIYAIFALWVYKKRPTEAAGRTMAFGITEPLIKTMLVIPATLVSGYLFSGIVSSGRYWYFFGCAFGFIIGCPLMEIIFRKDIKAVLKHPLQILFNGVCITAIMIVVQLDLFGYDTYIPDDDKVESYAVVFNDIDEIYGNYGSSVEKRLKNMHITGNESTRALLSYAAENSRNTYLIQEKRETNKNADRQAYSTIWVKYHLKNDKELYRRYLINMKDEQVKYWVENIYEDMDYKQAEYPIFTEGHLDQYKGIQLSAYYNTQEKFFSPDKMKAFSETYLEELRSLSIQEMTTEYPVAEIAFRIPSDTHIDSYVGEHTEMVAVQEAPYYDKGNDISYYSESGYHVYPSFTKTLALLEQYGFMVSNVIPEENLISFRITDSTEEADDFDGLYTKIVELEYQADDLTKAQLEQLFDAIAPGHMAGDFDLLKEREEYIDIRIGFYTENGFENVEYGAFKKGMIPDFVLEDLAKGAEELE